MICIYHNRDFDGFCSAAIVKEKYPDCKFIGWDYGLPTPQLPKGEEIIMVDVSFPSEIMEKVAINSEHAIIWIDHHISAIKDMLSYNFKAPGIVAFTNEKIAACEGTWSYCFGKSPLPMGVRLLGEYDSWRDQDKANWDSFVMPFQMGMRLICNSLNNFPAEIFRNGSDFCLDIINKGNVVLQYQDMQNEARCKNSAFERSFEGLRAICLIGVIGSQSFKSVWDANKYDIMIAASFQNEKWAVSLYTDKPELDVSEICKRYNGGGHRGAAGFRTENIAIIINANKINEV